MPVELKDMPRPAADNGRGLRGFPRPGWTGGPEGLDYWIKQLVDMRIKWFHVIDNDGDSLSLCEKLLDAGIFPIVRIIRNDPPPNDAPEPNPGHLGDKEARAIRRLIAAGVRYFETNNEPDLATEWKHGAMPGDLAETSRLVALNWLFDASTILEAGGCPALPAVSSAGSMDLIGALASLGRQEILLQGCWIAIHNHCLNRPLAYPDDPVNRSAQLLTREQYDLGAMTPWVWWNTEVDSADTIETINAIRARLRNPATSLLQDHACFRAFEYYDHLANEYLGRSIPIISTDGGYQIGHREDPRYGRVTPELHRDQTVAMYDFMQRQAPEYYFASVPGFLVGDDDQSSDAWFSPFWKLALGQGTDGTKGFPPCSVPGLSLDEHLPVVDAVKAMPSLARRHQQLEQDTPVPPVQITLPTTQIPTPQSEQTSIAAEPAAVQEEPDDDATSAETQTLQPADSPSQSNIVPAPTNAEQVLRDELREQYFPTRNEIEAETSDYLFAPQGDQPVEPEPTVAIPDAGESQDSAESEPTPIIAGESFAEIEPTNQPIIPEPPAQEPVPQLPRETRILPTFPSLLFSSDVTPVLNWDPRLDALHITSVPAQVATGEPFWKLVRAEYLGPSECEGKHLIYYVLEDEQGQRAGMQRVWQGWPEDKTDATTNDSGQATIPLWASFAPERGENGPYSAWVDGLPSDRVAGLGLPSKRHVSFMLTWRRTRA